MLLLKLCFQDHLPATETTQSEVRSWFMLALVSRFMAERTGKKDHSTGEQDGGPLQPIKANLSTLSAPMPSTPRPCQRSTTTNPPWCCGGSPETTRQRANWMAGRHPNEAKYIIVINYIITWQMCNPAMCTVWCSHVQSMLYYDIYVLYNRNTVKI